MTTKGPLPAQPAASWWRPSRHVPPTPWQASSRWKARPTTLAILVAGLWLFGTGEALLVRADLGVAPWTVLAQGLTQHLPIGIGVATALVSAAVLVLWIPLRERPGLGTIANALVIATSLQVMSGVLPTPQGVAVRMGAVVVGIVLIGIGSGMYLTTHLGPGPRDGWMTGIHLRTGWSVTHVRIGIELMALAIGWALGGTVGIGTVLFAILVGPSVGYSLMAIGRLGGRAAAAVDTADLDDVHPEAEA